MRIGSLVKQKVFTDGKGEDVFRYGVLYKQPEASLNLGWGWVFWQLNKDGPHAVSNESYCEAVQFGEIELVAEPK